MSNHCIQIPRVQSALVSNFSLDSEYFLLLVFLQIQNDGIISHFVHILIVNDRETKLEKLFVALYIYELQRQVPETIPIRPNFGQISFVKCRWFEFVKWYDEHLSLLNHDKIREVARPTLDIVTTMTANVQK